MCTFSATIETRINQTVNVKTLNFSSVGFHYRLFCAFHLTKYIKGCKFDYLYTYLLYIPLRTQN